MDKNFLEDILKKLKSKGADHADVIFLKKRVKVRRVDLVKLKNLKPQKLKKLE